MAKWTFFSKGVLFSLKHIELVESLLELPETLNNSLPADELKLLDQTCDLLFTVSVLSTGKLVSKRRWSMG